ncbi:hypothetical protein LP419_14600 [Massilia sp. H-1]|nr:hypothetical protein LP419_14600 [Massilia sp. H-1]
MKSPFLALAALLGAALLKLQVQARDPLIGLINAYRAAPGPCGGTRAAPLPPLPPLAAPAALSRVRVGAEHHARCRPRTG